MIHFKGRKARFFLDSEAALLWEGDRRIDLPRRQYELLKYLAERSEKLVSWDELRLTIWGGDNVNDEAISRILYKLRQSLGDEHPNIIETKRGYGVRFVGVIESASWSSNPKAEAPTRMVSAAVPEPPLLRLRLLQARESFYCHTVGVRNELTGTVFVLWVELTNPRELPISVTEYGLLVADLRLPSIEKSSMPSYANCTYVRVSNNNDPGRLLHFIRGWSDFEFDPLLNDGVESLTLQGGTAATGSLVFWHIPGRPAIGGDQDVRIAVSTSRGEITKEFRVAQLGV